MKRVLLLCFSVLSVITAFGCAGRPRAEKLFFYRDKNVSATVDMECNGAASSFSLEKNESGDIKIRFTAPAELCGFELSLLSDGTATVTVDGLTAPAPEPLTLIPNICSGILSVSESDAIGIETERIENEIFTRINTDGISVTVSHDGTPVGADGSYGGIIFRASFKEFSVATLP